VVKFWPAKGKSGFIVWRYMLRRDDPSPAPWTKDGQRRIEELGLTMQVNNCLTVTCFSQFSLRSGFAQLVTHWCRPRKFRV